ncbi:Cytochrome P450 E-class group I [Penicillium hordei]|uniref:Cytochrome P450 E-class group I n=1 Tax=Penicillium hordei TaxID=40994 RepID=A0AAD6E9A5_9EURO|nr:Cytochrome P450 E-class group I [Penicillium hordei]KAJ5606798.1 Cytochrome P450 E-class group I [Penicillium hordei]
MFIVYFTLALILGLLGVHNLRSYFIPFRYRSLPPGPLRRPIIGNLFDFPKRGSKEWEHWLKHKDLYGPISSLVTMGQTVILLNKSEVAYDLLEKRSAIYSSRPPSVFGAELAGWNRFFTMQGDPNLVRTHRKFISSLIGSKNAISILHPKLELGARHFLLQTLQHPGSLIDNIRREVTDPKASIIGAEILDITYGYKVEPSGLDPLIELADLSAQQFSNAVQVGNWIVDIIPIWAGFQRTAQEWGRVLTTLAERPYAFVLHQRSKQKEAASYVSRHLDLLNSPATPDEENTIKWTAAVIYSGGADTTVSSLSTFFLTMAQFPDIQRHAQAELDLVVGSRLPTLSDRPNLPYVDALIKEVMRWHPIGPLGIPHMTTQEDEYNGYRIPKGAVLIPNIWSFTHDPEIYNEPMTFNPSRFLQQEDGVAPECDPQKFVFGYGRRICPGRFLADTSLFLIISKSLAVFDITKRVGEDGKDIDLLAEYLPGIISHPSPFYIQVRPRSEHARMLIRSVEVEDPWLKGDSEVFNDIQS